MTQSLTCEIEGKPVTLDIFVHHIFLHPLSIPSELMRKPCMKFTQPIPFQEAVDKLGSRSVVGSKLRTKDWRDIPIAISDRAFFSAGIEDVRFLDNARTYLLDAVSGAKKTNERGETYYAMDRQKFVKEMQDYAVRNGIQPTGPGDLQDARSQTRLELIFDTQMKSAQDYGYWKQGQDQDILDAFPYQRFIRVTDVRTPRRRSERWEGIVRRKDDLDFWIMLNEDFGVPWGPWGFNSGMDVEDVAAEDAGEMIDRNPVMKDVLQPSNPVRPIDRDFNERLAASVRGISAEGRRHIEETFGGAVQISGDDAIFKHRAAEPVDNPSQKVQDDHYENGGSRRRNAEWEAPFHEAELRRVGQSAEDAIHSIYPEWRVPSGREDAERITKRVVEAQIAAAGLGSKPLYFDSWGDTLSPAFAAALRPVLPTGTEVHSLNGRLYVYRPEVVRPILDADPGFYRPNGENDLAAIDRISGLGQNGELLGYGARSDDKNRYWAVTLYDRQGSTFLYYSSTEETARATARLRSAEISARVDSPIYYLIEPPSASSP